MAKVIFTISYDVNPDKRDEFLALSQSMKAHVAKTNGKEYSIFEQKGKKNSFSEVFVFNSMEEYNQLDDQDEQMNDLVQKLEGLLVDGKMKYSTLVEIE
jgi:antibiotic biosynthesis monooxygenase (ABM) superfamily enzyme